MYLVRGIWKIAEYYATEIVLIGRRYPASLVGLYCVAGCRTHVSEIPGLADVRMALIYKVMLPNYKLTSCQHIINISPTY